MIAIIDYGLGNIRAFVNLYERLNISIRVAKTREDLKNVSKLILPGVGAFDHAITLLENSGMQAVIETLVLKDKLPILGICVGMQILAESSEEGVLPGLGWIGGKVKRIKVKSGEDLTASSGPRATSHELFLPLPHMGWNDIDIKTKDKIFKDFEDEPKFYFLHSYYFECADTKNSIATANYGGDFTCAVKKDNIYGVQFHPEKSHHNGIQLLKNFAEM